MQAMTRSGTLHPAVMNVRPRVLWVKPVTSPTMEAHQTMQYANIDIQMMLTMKVRG